MAPSRPLLGVPSSSIMVRSSAAWSAASAPFSALAISPLTLATALVTPLPPQLLAAVAQLDRLELAGRGARGHRRQAPRAGVEHDLDLDGRVAPRVEDLPRVDALNRGHAMGVCQGT